jgi:MFS transporter, DHA2 family, multidrug resistance protein
MSERPAQSPPDALPGANAAAPAGGGRVIRAEQVPGVVVSSAPAAAPGAGAAAPPAPAVQIPWLGLTAVLLGTFISTLNTRLSTFGLADIRGAVHAGFDDGAWITTAQTMAQMLVCPIAIWIGTVYGARQVLLEAAVAFAVIALIEPFAPNLPMLLALQFAGGLATGFFVPLTLSFVLRNMPPKAWAYGIALYALNLEVSLNISASFEGWYVDHLSWRWIFWQQVPLAAGMALCMHFGAPRDPVNPQPSRPDYFGFASGGLGLALIYAALDQGNRLDWLNSGLVWGLLVAGAVLLTAFFVHEAHTPNPGVNLKILFEAPLPRLLVMIAFLRLTILSTSYIIPQFLQVVRGFRALEVGGTLVWIAAPQFIICFIAGYVLRRVDPRLVASFGFLCVCVASLMVAHGLTPLWGSDQFLPSSLLQAVGQSFALSGTVFFAVLHLRPQDALTFASAIQVSRLMGGEMGTAFVVTFVRKRGQIASNLLGQHVQMGDVDVIQRIQAYAGATARAGYPPSGASRGETVLNNVVHGLSSTQGIIDAFVAIAAATALVLIVIVTRRAAPPHPAAHVPIFGHRAETPQ